MISSFDVVVIGSGPAGQKAAIQAAKAGRRVVVIEKSRSPGGACVQHGTIPSKTLRETIVAFANFQRRSAGTFDVQIPENVAVASLMTRKDEVVHAHERYIDEQLKRNGITRIHGRAKFLSPNQLEVLAVDGTKETISGALIMIAAGSQPRTPPGIPIDHESILDSDSILSLIYLPRSLTVLGAGVVASEYASMFAVLGVKVTMIDRADRPISFLDRELSDRFASSFERAGGRFLGKRLIAKVENDGLSVITHLEDGEVIRSEKMLCALGRVAALDHLSIGSAGLSPDARGLLAVDEHYRTSVPHIYAVGDVIGPPSLAASAMEQGRCAMRHALGIVSSGRPELIPIGIYTIPEMASIGLTEDDARAKHGVAIVGRSRFDEIARGHIAGIQDGLLKMIADGEGKTLLGVQIIGEGATELIHVGQMALVAGSSVDTFIENVFNFPTLAEAYRVAALDIARQR